MLIEKKLLLFGGKGGVGKTSCAAATALYAASKGKKTLVVSTDPAHSLADSLGVEIGNKITPVTRNLDAMEINAAALLQQYKMKNGVFIKQIADEGTFFSKQDIQKLFDLSFPGIDELMALIQINEILGTDLYDLLVVDTAPTGHTIRLLELPEMMEGYVKLFAEMRQKHKVVVSMMVGRNIKEQADEFIIKMHNDIERIKATLQDSQQTQFIPITIPEAMSILETEKLVHVLEQRSIAIGAVFINGVLQPNCNFCIAKKNEQAPAIAEIRKKFGKYVIKEIPLFPGELREERLATLGSVLFDEHYKLPEPPEHAEFELSSEKVHLKPTLKFLLFGGKGGVGKTSCAAAAALYAAKEKKVLIFSTDPAHSLSDSFGVKIGNTITAVAPNLDALEIDAFALLHDMKKKYKKEIHDFFSSLFKTTSGAGFHGTIDAPYDRKVMEDLFDLVPPGIDELMAIKTIMDLMNERKYDLFILDTAPSGHTIRLLELPEIAQEWVTTLSDILEQYPLSVDVSDSLQEMRKTIQDVRKMLADSARSEFVIVTIPETMSVLETKDLLGSLQRLKVAVHYLIINKIIPKSECGFCSSKRSEQAKHIKHLQTLKLTPVHIALFDKQIQGENLNTLADILCKA